MGSARLVGFLLLAIATLSVPADAALVADNTRGRIAFVSSDGIEVGNIYIVRADGSGLRNLTRRRARYGGPSWSPDGSRIVFEAERCTPPSVDCRGAVYSINADGTGLRRLPRAKGTPTWSPRGDLIAFVLQVDRKKATYRTAIFVSRPDWNGVRRLTHPSHDIGGDWGPSWSPDGRKITFTRGNPTTSETAVYMMNADGSGIHRLTPMGYRDAQWSPKGRTVVVTSGSGQIVLMRLDRGHRRTFLSRGHTPVWSPDGQQIAFTDGRKIYVTNADGTGLRKIVPARGDGSPVSRQENWAPEWAPR